MLKKVRNALILVYVVELGWVYIVKPEVQRIKTKIKQKKARKYSEVKELKNQTVIYATFDD